MKRIKITELVERFERDNEIKQLADGTKRYYREFIACFTEWLPQSVKTTARLTQDLFETYTYDVVQRVENRTSQTTYLRAVRRLYNYGIEIGAIATCKLKLPKGKRTVKPTFTDEEVKRILTTRTNGKADIIALLLITTGIRSETLRSLTVADVVEADNAIILRHLKNGKQAVLPLPEMVTRRIMRYIRANEKQGVDLLFVNARGEKYSNNGLYEYLEKYLKRKGIEHKGIHIFRHTYAKLLAQSGCPSITLARCLTHSTVTQSEHYVNLYGQELRNACERYNPVVTLGEKYKKKHRVQPVLVDDRGLEPRTH